MRPAIVIAQCTPPADIYIEWTFDFDFDALGFDNVGWDVAPIDDDNDGSADDGFVIVGSTINAQSSSDVLVVLIDENKNEVWSEDYGGGGDDIAYGVIQSSYNDKIIVFGKINDDYFDANNFTNNIWLLEIDLADPLAYSEAQYGSSGNETGFAIAEAPSGQYVIAGKTGSYTHDDEDLDGHVINGLGDYWVLEIDEVDFSLDWDMNFHGMYTGGTSSDQATGVTVDEDGNYIVTGSCISCDPNKIQDQLMLVKIEPDNSYDTIMRYYGDDTERDQVAWDFAPVDDDDEDELKNNGIVVVGETDNDDPDNIDAFIIRFDEDGNEIWRIDTIGGGSVDIAYAVEQASDDNLIICGKKKIKYLWQSQ
jgi:hypothetical protein